MEVKREKITPRVASDYLARLHPKQRVIKKAHVATLVAAMSSGTFNAVTAPIVFDEKGHLIDGQHRLLAIRESGFSQDLLVQRGVPESLLPYMDLGKNRNMADRTALPQKATEILMALLRILNSEHTPEPAQIEALYVRYSPWLSLVTAHSAGKGATAALKAALVMLCDRSPDQAPWIDAQLQAFLADDHQTMTKSVFALYRRLKVLRNVSTTDRATVFNLALAAFDPHLPETRRLQTSDSRMVAPRKALESALRSVFY